MQDSDSSSSRLSAVAGGLLKFSAILFGSGLLVYIVLVAWLHHHLASQAVSITQAAGMPAEAERVLKGFLSWLIAFALLPALVRLAAESLNPFRSADKVLRKLAALIAIGFCAAMFPHGLRVLRGVDAKGLPVRMEPSDPARAMWWNPDGEPILFHSREADGSIRFWNRPGITPDTGSDSRPVTRESRRDWEQRSKDSAASAAEEKRILEAANIERRRHDEEQRQMQAKLQARTAEATRETELARAETESARRRMEEENARASRLADEREQLRAELAKERDAERKAVVAAVRSPNQTAPATSAARGKTESVARPAALPWDSRAVYPGRYFNIWGFRHPYVEIRLPVECEIEVQGMQPRVYAPGIVVIPLPSHGNFRIRSRASRPFNIQFRPANA